MIEVIISPSSGNTVAATPFLEQQQLLNRKVVAIETFCAEDMAYSPLSSGVPIIPVALFNAGFMSIMRAGDKGHGNEGQRAGLWYKNMPLSSLRRVQNNYTGLNPSGSFSRELFRTKPMYFQWPDTTINFPTTQTQAATYSVPFLVHFLLEGEDPRPYGG